MPDAKPKIKKEYWYVIGAGAAILAYLLYRHYSSSSSSSSQLAAEEAALAAEPSGATAGDTESDTGTTTTTSTTPTTLAGWLSSVQSWAVSSLGSDPAVVQNALQAYANGECLTSQEYNIVDQGLGAFGFPPDAPTTGLVQCAPTVTGSPTSGSGTVTTGPSTTDYADILNQEVGALSSSTNFNATQSEVQQWIAAGEAQGLSGDALNQYVQSQNVGALSRDLKQPSLTQVNSLAYELAGGQGNFNALSSVQQNQVKQLANVQLLGQLNNKAI